MKNKPNDLSLVDFRGLGKRLDSVRELPVYRDVETLWGLIGTHLSEIGEASDDLRSASVPDILRAHKSAYGLALLRCSDRRPFPNVLDTIRWCAQYTYAMLYAEDKATAATFGDTVNEVLQEARSTAHPERGYIYFIRHPGREEIKIGFAMNVQHRMSQLRSAMPHGIEVLLVISGTLEDEAGLHRRFTGNRISSQNEWFKPTSELLDYIKQEIETGRGVPTSN